MSLKDETLYATLTDEGQLTLPKVLRDELHLSAGDKVALRLRGGEVVLQPAARTPRDLSAFIGILKIEGSAEELISEMRHTPEERRDLQAATGQNRIIKRSGQ
ncbi:AbrB/MazE/SpoVT family DNA-binding domain-containing protein [Deinococcus detaillensis]|uniref:AbrB/MazE/SpoVT family DNA-binding domain-containing protein n=1 Tax=Deinococcus detaillensis TaxID=2592048 RepID=A0A553V6L8_9DEIO|nr:AbrB/MazE/SpoVT family DNA-binding domain-containing protein [Deinococcus detaillensis]TSA87871.1 AbrB/MazE/SpoVT family DNA-binding domain-containing protein [Deinococcus detaillensis]